jgi:maltoporin
VHEALARGDDGAAAADADPAPAPGAENDAGVADGDAPADVPEADDGAWATTGDGAPLHRASASAVRATETSARSGWEASRGVAMNRRSHGASRCTSPCAAAPDSRRCRAMPSTAARPGLSFALVLGLLTPTSAAFAASAEKAESADATPDDAAPKGESSTAPSSTGAKPASVAVAPPPPPASAPAEAANVKTTAPSGDFSFGSYGRVIAGSDLRGGEGRQANIVGHGTRIDESSYAELQLERRDRYAYEGRTFETRVVSTLGIAGPLFHQTGQFDAQLAVRNLYAEVSGLFADGLSVWGGSRMYRGDDIYLLDFWPLDNLNTVGGGFRFAFDTTSKKSTSVAFHVGMSRPLDPFTYQTVTASSVTGFGGQQVVVLNRLRVVSSAKLEHVERIGPTGGVKAVLYGEYHAISSGTQELTDGSTTTNVDLPKDHGSVIGLQLGAFRGKRDTFLNLFLRMATGIAAYGDKTVPSALAPDRTATAAREYLAALSGNFEEGPVGVLLGAYVRGVKDASGNPYSRNTFNEGTLVVRPHLWIGEHAGIAVEGSYQALSTAFIDDTGQKQHASLWRFGVIPFLTPAGRGSFTRPQLRLIYAYTSRSDGARALYAAGDVYARRREEHFLGLGVEWWFNSSYR